MAAVPIAARFEPSTRTLRSVPGNHWLATMDSWDGAIDHPATARALAGGLSILHRLAALDSAEAAPIVDQIEIVQALAIEARAILEA